MGDFFGSGIAKYWTKSNEKGLSFLQNQAAAFSKPGRINPDITDFLRLKSDESVL